MHDNFFLKLYKFDTLNIPGFRNWQDIKKRKRVALTIENKLEACKLVKSNVPKSVIIEQFSIGRLTLYNILKSEEKFKRFYYLLWIAQYTAVILFYEKIRFLVLIWKNAYPDMFTEKTCPTIIQLAPDKWISSVLHCKNTYHYFGSIRFKKLIELTLFPISFSTNL